MESRKSINRVLPCPRCKKATRYDPQNAYRPFCSERCKNIDILAWAAEDYRMAGEPADPETIPSAIKIDDQD